MGTESFDYKGLFSNNYIDRSPSSPAYSLINPAISFSCHIWSTSMSLSPHDTLDTQYDTSPALYCPSTNRCDWGPLENISGSFKDLTALGEKDAETHTVISRFSSCTICTYMVQRKGMKHPFCNDICNLSKIVIYC